MYVCPALATATTVGPETNTWPGFSLAEHGRPSPASSTVGEQERHHCLAHALRCGDGRWGLHLWVVAACGAIAPLAARRRSPTAAQAAAALALRDTRSIRSGSSAPTSCRAPVTPVTDTQYTKADAASATRSRRASVLPREHSRAAFVPRLPESPSSLAGQHPGGQAKDKGALVSTRGAGSRAGVVG